MKHNHSMKVLLPILLVAGVSAGAQTAESGAANVALEPPPEPQKNRASVNYRFGWNVRASFENLGGFPAFTIPTPANPGPAAGGAVDRIYDNGYVRVDNTGNNHGPGYENTTWYWGYQSGSQDSADGWNLSFSAVSTTVSAPASAASLNSKDDAVPGVEVVYGRELFRNEKWRWGVELAAGYGAVAIHDSRNLSADLNVSQSTTRDTYSVPANSENPGVPVSLPGAPYAGSYDGFGVGYAVIGSLPTRSLSSLATTVPGGASITGTRQLDADLWGFRLGPYVEIPLSPKWTLAFSGGLALVDVASEFKFTETVSVSEVGEVSRSGKDSSNDLLVGGYVAGSLAYAFNEHWSLFSSLQYQSVGEMSQTVAGKRAVLDLGDTLFVTLGVSYGF